MTLRTYPLTDPPALWEEVVSDVYYEIPYLRVAALHEEGEIVLCVYRHSKGLVIYPFVLRPLAQLPFYDITTPFGYGGPLVQATDAQAVQVGFREAFGSYCRSQGIISEFVRFNPLLHNQEGWDGFYELRKCCDNVVIDLSKSSDTIFAEYKSNTRNKVHKARRRGVQIERANKTAVNIHLFMDIYHHTMDRVNAMPSCYFSSAYFERLVNLSDDLVSLYFARDGDGKGIGAALFLHSQKYAHYHLSGTVTALNRLASNNLLLHNVALDMQCAGKRYLHLGGAAADQEGLLTFKRGFSGDHREYYVGMCVHDPIKYKAAQAVWATANPDRLPTDYFPVYRS